MDAVDMLKILREGARLRANPLVDPDKGSATRERNPGSTVMTGEELERRPARIERVQELKPPATTACGAQEIIRSY